jgi:hypothetical protein
MNSELILTIADAALKIVVALIIAYLVPWARKELAPFLKTAFGQFIVSIGVKAAEQAYKEMEKSGDKKKQYVLDWLKQKGIIIDPVDLDKFIDSAVKDLEKLKNAAKGA